MSDYERNRVIEVAISTLAEVAMDGETLGYRDGPAPSLEVRSAALRSLASYVPHPKAVEVLTRILTDDWYGHELRKVAAEALRNK
jgi:hypothetical protein